MDATPNIAERIRPPSSASQDVASSATAPEALPIRMTGKFAPIARRVTLAFLLASAVGLVTGGLAMPPVLGPEPDTTEGWQAALFARESFTKTEMLLPDGVRLVGLRERAEEAAPLASLNS